MVFRRVADARPYPEHGLSARDWSGIPARQIALVNLVTTKRSLDVEQLFSRDETMYGDLFAHVVRWQGEDYLEDGLHRAVRAGLQHRGAITARVLDLDQVRGVVAAARPAAARPAAAQLSVGQSTAGHRRAQGGTS